MAIPPISAAGVAPISPTFNQPKAAAPTPGEGGGFGETMSKAIDAVSESHAEADRLSVQAATGDLTAVHDFTIAATEAQLLTQLTVEVRNRAIESFNDIMRMQV